MAYVTSALIAAEFKGLDLSSSTAVTTAKIEEMIVQEEALLTAQIGTVYAMPIVSADSPISFSIMRMLSTLLVRDRIEAMLAVKTGGKTPDQGDETDTPWMKKAKDIIEKILNKSMLLPDASLLNASGGVQSYQSANELLPTFEKGTKQW